MRSMQYNVECRVKSCIRCKPQNLIPFIVACLFIFAETLLWHRYLAVTEFISHNVKIYFSVCSAVLFRSVFFFYSLVRMGCINGNVNGFRVAPGAFANE
jgi:hypothetical protein